MRSLILSVAALTLLSQNAQAQLRMTFEKVATAGKPQQVGRVISIDPDCKPLTPPSMSIIEEPRQGRVTTADGRDFPSFPSANPRSRCNSRKLPAIKIIYTAPAGATGDDVFTIEYVDKFGTPRQERFHVTIR